MGERAKIILNEWSAKAMLTRENLDLDNFYMADLKLMIEAARKEIKKLQEENILLRASEPMSKLQEDYGYKEEVNRLNNIINELGKDLYKIRELTFTKYNSNEWNNCLSFNDDILPIINKISEVTKK